MKSFGRLSRRGLASVPALLILLGLPVAAALGQEVTATAAPGEGGEIERFQWQGRLEAGATVRVDNAFGDVRARFGGWERAVEVLGVVQRQPGEPGLRVGVEEATDGVSVSVSRPVTGEAVKAALDANSESPDRVDLVVFVPDGAALRARTADGLIECRGLRSAVDLGSEGGDIRIKSNSGQIHARTARGSLSAVLLPGVTEAGQSLETVTGEITAFIRDDADMVVHAATSGEIGTDFSIEVDRRRLEEPDKLAVATVGRGGPELVLRSKRGPIHLRWYPAPAATEGGQPDTGHGALRRH